MLDKKGILDKIQGKAVDFKACIRTGRYREAKNIYDDLIKIKSFVELDEAWGARIFGTWPGRDDGLITEREVQMAYRRCCVEKNISEDFVTYDEFRRGLHAGDLAGKRQQCLQEVKPCSYPDCETGQRAACGSLS